MQTNKNVRKRLYKRICVKILTLLLIVSTFFLGYKIPAHAWYSDGEYTFWLAGGAGSYSFRSENTSQSNPIIVSCWGEEVQMYGNAHITKYEFDLPFTIRAAKTANGAYLTGTYSMAFFNTIRFMYSQPDVSDFSIGFSNAIYPAVGSTNFNVSSNFQDGTAFNKGNWYNIGAMYPFIDVEFVNGISQPLYLHFCFETRRVVGDDYLTRPVNFYFYFDNLRLDVMYPVSGSVGAASLINAVNNVNDSVNEVNNSVNEVNGTLQQQWQDQIDSANNAVNGDESDMSSMILEAKSLETKWDILWLPIKFTNQVINVFTGGTSSSTYNYMYGSVEGYTYDEETGFLIPVLGSYKPLPLDDAEHAYITWPEYTLPVLDVKLWDSYTYDLAQVKQDFPLLFNAIYVVTTILELYWIVAFLRDKYEEVFG